MAAIEIDPDKVHVANARPTDLEDVEGCAEILTTLSEDKFVGLSVFILIMTAGCS
jgi:hypothetical protein